ncbi:putative MFS family arabinose efflux permease [Pontibacter ummariensis]|uniref:Predicted arabinose efflux permease, MFS family n=1 Tax=Pontibacter ummariensis TaxID=1610492 RepID=A0A239JM53_9BACT|nr:MFS transporter [Pontibacter ummariensis]PRY07866.1 putative MFS family arabinose efflux permease [Pontibacter ummariensis]SNT06403.1 Predicted arabinose efflux permease, MFS family [Pontibacter ummariensis]
MEEAKPSKLDPYAVLRLPEFRSYIAARLCITLAMQIQAVIVGWQIYDITQDPLSLGLIGLAEAVPSITVSLYAGYVADMIERKKIIMVVITILLLCSALLLLFTLDVSQVLEQYGALPIFGVIFLSGIARGFMGPAVFSFMPQLVVNKQLYANAITWSTTTWQAASLAGPAIGGLIYGFFGVTAAYAADATLVLVSLLSFALIGSKPLPENVNPQNLMESLRTGIRFVFSNQIVLSAISLDLFAVLFGGAVALLPVFASDILETGPEGLGFLRAAPAVGSVLIAVVMAYKPIEENAGKKMLWCVAGFGVCIILFGLSRSFWFSLVLLALSGAFDSISMIVRSTLIHTLTPEYMKGRVSSVNNIFVGSSNEIGAFESGFTAKLMGVVPAVVFGGVMTLVVVGVTAFKAEKLRELDLTPEPVSPGTLQKQ